MSATPPTARIRREPPAFRRVAVARVTAVTPRLIRVTVGGPELDGLVIEQPAASVRLLLPSPGSPELVMPTWNGNEFLLPDGSRPAIRTLTPLRLDPAVQELDLEIVVHDGGAASAWAQAAQPGDEAAISGPGRGYPIDPEATGFLLGGDESAIPAISQLLELLPTDKPVHVLVVVADPVAR
ncbi:MAG TPA: siderophore-interacting protein, partial [Acidimicrobiia bacterium]|nr:siderophore-interacting protein [Acidimicrobiia bacterium]